MIAARFPSPDTLAFNKPARTILGRPAVRVTDHLLKDSYVLPLRTFGALLAFGEHALKDRPKPNHSGVLSRAYDRGVSTVSKHLLFHGTKRLLNGWNPSILGSAIEIDYLRRDMKNTVGRYLPPERLEMDCVLPPLCKGRSRRPWNMMGLRLEGGLDEIMADEVIAGLCGMHGVESLQTPPLGMTASWGETRNGISLRYRDLPSAFPSFEFRPDTTLLTGDLKVRFTDDVLYRRNGATRSVSIRTTIPETVRCSLVGTPLAGVARIPLLEDETVKEARQDGGRLTMVLKEKSRLTAD